jgi:hypothetical protein
MLYIQTLAVPQLRSLVIGFSPRRSGFLPRAVHVKILMGRGGQGQVFLQVIISELPHFNCVSCAGRTLNLLAAAIPPAVTAATTCRGF